MDTQTARLHLRLTDQELTDARKIAAKRGTTVSEIIRAFIRRTAHRDARKNVKGEGFY